MPSITIELTDTQYKGMQYIALSPEDWAENAVLNRAKKANDEIVQLVVQHCLDNDIQVPATREAIVAYGFDNEIVKTIEQQDLERQAQEQAESN